MRSLVPKSGAVWSYRKKHGVEAFWGHGETILFECEHVPFDRFADITDGVFFCVSLADTAWQTWAFRHPKVVLAGIKDYLPHRSTLSRFYHVSYTLRVRETRPGGGVGTIGGILDRSTGRYSVSRSTGTRPAARIRRSSSARGVNSDVLAPAS